jgi:phosphoglycolate phosphatase
LKIVQKKSGADGFRAVIFDLDGTLLDSLGGIGDTMNALLKRLGYPQHPLTEYRYLVGDGLERLVERSLPPDWSQEYPPGNRGEAAIEQLVKDYRRLYDEKWPGQSPPYPGVPELLEKLTREKIKIAVLSNKSDDFTRRMAETLLPGSDFAAVVGARPGIPGKPHPVAALEIADRMGIAPGEMIFLGDSGVDMQTGVNAGMYPVGALWGFREADELLDHGANALLEKPAELLQLLVS